MIVKAESMRFDPPLRVRVNAAVVNEVGTIASLKTTSTVAAGVFRSAGLEAPTLTMAGTPDAKVHESEAVPEPASPK